MIVGPTGMSLSWTMVNPGQFLRQVCERNIDPDDARHPPGIDIAEQSEQAGQAKDGHRRRCGQQRPIGDEPDEVAQGGQGQKRGEQPHCQTAQPVELVGQLRPVNDEARQQAERHEAGGNRQPADRQRQAGIAELECRQQAPGLDQFSEDILQDVFRLSRIGHALTNEAPNSPLSRATASVRRRLRSDIKSGSS